MHGRRISNSAAGLGTRTPASPAKTPKQTGVDEREENKASSLLNGPVNLTESGNPYPIALGRNVRTGSVVVDAALTTEQFDD